MAFAQRLRTVSERGYRPLCCALNCKRNGIEHIGNPPVDQDDEDECNGEGSDCCDFRAHSLMMLQVHRSDQTDNRPTTVNLVRDRTTGRIGALRPGTVTGCPGAIIGSSVHVLSVSNLQKMYEATVAVDEISFVVKANEIVGLL